MTQVTGVVLAGGRSARLGGRPKALLPVEGRPLIARTVELLARLADPVVVSARRPEAFAFLGRPIVLDRVGDAGPLAGIVAALEASPHELCLVVACDAPRLRLELLAHLVERARATGALATLPRAQGVLHPLVAVYRRALASTLRSALARGERAVHRAVPSPEIVDEAELRRYDADLVTFDNVNTPEDLARVLGSEAARAALAALRPEEGP